jgi:uncharacterized repeat protein (TIGR03803 family)
MSILVRSIPAILFSLAAMAQAQTTYRESVLHGFAVNRQPMGANPYADLIRDDAGNFYGTAYAGGAWDQGVVFKIDAAGQTTVLLNFTGGAGGGRPLAGVIRDEAGNLYGTTQFGGNLSGQVCGQDMPAHGCGVVYKLDPVGRETVLYAFMAADDGAFPDASLYRDQAGNLYGTTQYGGANLSGTVFKLDQAGHFTLLYGFTGGLDGSSPNAGVVRDQAGNLYGTTTFGGHTCSRSRKGCGVVYKLDPAGHQTVLHAFTDGDDGGEPYAGLILDSDGNIYGTTEFGGSGGQGVVFKLDRTGHQTVLYAFTTGGTDGANPRAALFRDQNGVLYGTASSSVNGDGGVFKVDPSGQETVLYNFTGPNGKMPQAGVILDPAGNIYGTAAFGGASDDGVVFKLDASGRETVVSDFPARPDGAGPQGGVVRDAAGNLFGTAIAGGASNFNCVPPGASGCGVVYKIDPAGHETVLHAFTYDDGAEPRAGLTMDAAGNLYGTTYLGGLYSYGVVFKVDPSGQETVLHSFNAEAGNDGGLPYAGVVLDGTGNLYGTTWFGGKHLAGSVYKLDPAGVETILHSFAGEPTDGTDPTAGVVLDPAGNIYGTTFSGGSTNHGVIYKLDTSGTYTVLHNFTGAAGAGPNGLIIDQAGNLYGTAEFGGACAGIGCGVFFKLDKAGNYTALYYFTGTTDGANPRGILTLDEAGNFYGTTTAGGTEGKGVVFKFDSAGHEAVLYSFKGPPDGRIPYAGVTLDATGNIYGTTYLGGKQGVGVVFKLTPQ